jgi:very-short-patch-repair endonuclease
MTITAKELRKQLSPDVAALSAKALAELDGRNVDPVTLENNAGALGVEVANPLAARFEALWQRWEGPALVREYKFSAARRWRADYAHLATRTLIELEGGIYSGGRHSRAAGFLADVEKYNAAAMLGYTVLRLGTGQVDDAHVGEIADWVRRQTKGAR